MFNVFGLLCHEVFHGFVENTGSEDEVLYTDAFVYAVFQFDYLALGYFWIPRVEAVAYATFFSEEAGICPSGCKHRCYATVGFKFSEHSGDCIIKRSFCSGF